MTDDSEAIRRAIMAVDALCDGYIELVSIVIPLVEEFPCICWINTPPCRRCQVKEFLERGGFYD